MEPVVVASSSPIRSIALGAQVARQLRIGIITGRIPAGLHLAEDALAAQYEVSRGPVRDALKALLKEGLVEQRRTRLYARGLTLKDVDELYGLRELIEVAAVCEAIDRAGTSEWAEGDSIVGRMRAAAQAKDVASFAAADMAFHDLIYRLSENRRLAEVWRQFGGTFNVLFELSNNRDMPAAVLDHERILSLLVSGDADLSAREVRNHLARARGHIRDVVKAIGGADAVDRSEAG